MRLEAEFIPLPYAFDAARMAGQKVVIDGPYVDARLKALSRDDDLSRYIL